MNNPSHPSPTLSPDYKLEYERLKKFVRGNWKGDCSECAAIANTILNKESNEVAP